ncbi:hypothetical protein HZH68_003268 [Vespula germanica]|uniref:Uncharacterized protein n=1 Tax=Vespula germanica TaxID=30212 RepID=A0A834U2Z2_VESGE|nr:hypothetical protein HZH68_003268 [Vespula germanica]
MEHRLLGLKVTYSCVLYGNRYYASIPSVIHVRHNSLGYESRDRMSVVCGRAPLYDNDDNDDYDDYDDDDYENEDDGNVARNAAGDHDKYDSVNR